MKAAFAILLLIVLDVTDAQNTDVPNTTGLMSLLVMADIGHSREHADRLTSQWPMGKCAFEGSFSLYEGLRDYITRQGAKPTAAIILGDVGYGGGSKNATKDVGSDMQKYLAGQVSKDRVFVTIGNHDIHYLGCTNLNRARLKFTCYYGDATQDFIVSTHSISFSQWRSNWLENFPGLVTNTILPPRNLMSPPWLAPLRYNLNLDQASSVYIIAGLNSGAHMLSWNGDTPPEAVDAVKAPLLECRFLADSLQHGRRLGKTIFLYMTHHFTNACNDWTLLSQIDVWVYGHRHAIWQSALSKEVIQQEERYYPVRLLIGNGGFDEGQTNVVSFVHVTEEVIPGREIGEDRIRLNFDVFDTCVSNETSCPDSSIGLKAACWKACKAVPGGYDNGGGPRAATPSMHGFGFHIEAPRKPQRKPPSAERAPYGGSWKLKVKQGDTWAWLMLGNCPCKVSSTSKCVRSTQERHLATPFYFYHSKVGSDDVVSARLAAEEDARAPLMSGSNDFNNTLLYRSAEGFWHETHGVGTMFPSSGHVLRFAQTVGPGKHEQWTLLDVAWQSTRERIVYTDALTVQRNSSLEVMFSRSWPKEPDLESAQESEHILQV